MKNVIHTKKPLLLAILLLSIPLHLVYAWGDPKGSEKAVDSLIDVSFQQFLKIDIEGNIKTANEALSISKDLNYSEGISKSYFYLARALSYLGEYQKALDYLRFSENETYTQDNVDIHSEICRIKGQIFMYIGLPSASIREFNRGIYYINQIREKNKRQQLRSLAYENLSISYENIHEYDTMYYYLDKNKKLLETYNFPYNNHNKINMYTLFGDYYVMKEDYDTAGYFFNKALGIAEANNMNYTSWIHKHWGDMEYKRGNYDAALTYFHLALDNLRKTQMKNEFQELYKQMAKAYGMIGLEDSAKIYNDNAVRAENEYLNARQSATENALNILLEEKESRLNNTFKSKITILTYIIAGASALSLIIWMQWRIRNRRKIKGMEKKVEDLQLRLSKNMQELIELAKANDNTFIARFMKSYPKFTKNIYQKHPDLINSEFWFCAMLFLDFSSKEIAQYSFVEHRSVQIRKGRLRKKLKIDSDVDLYHYIKSFQLESIVNS